MEVGVDVVVYEWLVEDKGCEVMVETGDDLRVVLLEIGSVLDV